MNLEETKQLLRNHRIFPNKLMGQNFMVAPSLYPQLCKYAVLNQSDVVLDVGAGFGWLACYLADKCRTVIAVEKDPHVAKMLREQIKGLSNVIVIEGNVLTATLPTFNKVIAIPPYYLSSRLMKWIFGLKIDCAVMILQKEFAFRLVAPIGSEEYGWLTVVSNQCAKVELLDSVPKSMFYPEPRVESTILRLKLLNSRSFEVKNPEMFVNMVKWLFTQRNKKLGKALVPFIQCNFKLSKQEAENLAPTLPLFNRRARELSPKDFGALANALPN